jgi:hypothetical protein
LLRVDLQALQDRGDFLSYVAPFVLSKDTTGPINQFEIIRELEGQTLGHPFPGVPYKRQQVRRLVRILLGLIPFSAVDFCKRLKDLPAWYNS